MNNADFTLALELSGKKVTFEIRIVCIVVKFHAMSTSKGSCYDSVTQQQTRRFAF